MFVAVYFDSEGEQKVRDLWAIGHHMGFDPKMQALGIRPHLTLGAWDTVNVDGAADVLRRLAAKHLRFGLTFDLIGSFAVGKGAFVLIPHVSRELMSLHADLHDGISALHTGPWKHYTPGHWTPHCTLAMNIDDARMAEAFVAIRGRFRPFTVTVQEITLAEAYPLDTKVLLQMGTRLE